MTETIVVSLIAGISFVLSLRWFYRTIAGKSEGCACGESSCSEATSCEGVKDAICRK